MDEAAAELAAYFQRGAALPDEDLVRLTAAARAAGSRWEAISAGCGVTAPADTRGVVALPSGVLGENGAELLFQATQYATEQLTASPRWPPLTWPCPGCGRQVTDRVATGRPVHTELGHAPACGRLARDQAADDDRRRARLPRLIADSEPPAGLLRRHRLRERITDDCPRCGWHGRFERIATIGGDWRCVRRLLRRSAPRHHRRSQVLLRDLAR